MPILQLLDVKLYPPKGYVIALIPGTLVTLFGHRAITDIIR